MKSLMALLKRSTLLTSRSITMKIKQLIRRHQTALTNKYGKRLLPSHRKALDALLACRSHCGEFQVACEHCGLNDSMPLSCGHRSCPQCQNHLGALWLERQKRKLLQSNYLDKKQR